MTRKSEELKSFGIFDERQHLQEELWIFNSILSL